VTSLLFVLILSVLSYSSAFLRAQTATGKPPATSTAKPSPKAQPKAPAKSTAGKKKSGKTTTASKSRKGKTRTAQASRQQQPEPSRIREIQQALSDHGYPVAVTGQWGSDSVEALKKFQEDQNINNLSGRGKLDSLTLIALGLGPSREPPANAQPTAEAKPEGKKQ
jgi:hypothetical protein